MSLHEMIKNSWKVKWTHFQERWLEVYSYPLKVDTLHNQMYSTKGRKKRKNNNKKFQNSVAVACSPSKAQKSSVSLTGFTQFQGVLVKMQKKTIIIFSFI